VITSTSQVHRCVAFTQIEGELAVKRALASSPAGTPGGSVAGSAASAAISQREAGCGFAPMLAGCRQLDVVAGAPSPGGDGEDALAQKTCRPRTAPAPS
jgi:hypothetical protein